MTEPHVAVVPHKMVSGLRPPTDGKTWDFTKLPRTPGNEAAVVAHCRVLPLIEACATKWRSDALMMAPVVMRDGAPVYAQPRLTKSSLAAVRAAGFDVVCWTLVADFDSVPKSEWNDERRGAQLEKIIEHPAFVSGLWYFTARGLRLVHTLKEPVPVEQYEALMASWRAELLDQGLGMDEFGLLLDPACKDWTRLQGLRDVVRPDGLFQSYPLGGRLVLRERPTATAQESVERAQKRKAGKRIDAPSSFAEALPERWVGRAQALSAAMLSVREGWNDAFLCLSGALVQRGVPGGEIPAIIEAVSRGTQNDNATDNRVTNARRTVDLAVRGEPIRGWDALLVGYPRVADALERALVNLGANGEPLPPRAAAGLELQEALRNAPDGVSGIEAGCGTGKTYNTEEVACSRARRGGQRDVKTVISAPTNKLAKQIASNVARRGLPVLRVFSPPSELGADGEPVCRFAASAREIAGAGLSVPFEFCQGRGDDDRACPYRDECTVASGFEGDPEAKVVVGNHGLLGRLAKDAGKTGLFAIDEPPPVLVTHRISGADLARLRQLWTAFAKDWVEAMSGAVEMAEWWLNDMLPEVPSELSRMIPDYELDRVRESPAQTQIRWPCMERARDHGDYARELGQAGRAASILRSVWGSEARWIVWVEERVIDGQRERTLMFTGPDERLVSVLRREGRTVLLDAALDVPGYSAACGYDLAPRVSRVWARDGAPVARTWLRWGAGTRKRLIEGGVLQVSVFANALRRALSWAAEDPRCKRVGVFCIKPFRACLDAALAMLEVDENGDSGNAQARAQNCLTKAGVPRRYADTIRDCLVPVLAAFGGTIETGHYGALRGLDGWIGADATITLGDPWPSLLATKHEHAYFAGTTSEGASRSRWQVERELEQAHGRLRAPGLSAPARALHVGTVLPRGPGWDAAEYREMDGGRPANVSTVTADELREWIKREHRGSIRAAAKALSLSDKTLRRYLDPRESRAVPPEVANHVRGAAETPNRYTPIRGFGRRDTPGGVSDEHLHVTEEHEEDAQ